MQLAGRCLDHTNVVLFPYLAERSARLFAKVQLNLDSKLRRRTIDSSQNAVTRLHPVMSYWPYNRLKFQARQLSIALLSAIPKALRLGLKHIEVQLSMIAHEAKDEFALELEGPPALWANDATQAWRRREALLRIHGKTIIHSVAVVAIDTTSKIGMRLNKAIIRMGEGAGKDQGIEFIVDD